MLLQNPHWLSSNSFPIPPTGNIGKLQGLIRLETNHLELKFNTL